MSTPYLGEIRLFGFSRTPNGWLSCDGSLQPISAYETLFALLGTTFGGDGQNTFGLPDLRGQIPLHWGSGAGLSTYVLGQAGGSESVTLTPNQMPAHNHAFAVTSNLANATTPASTLQLGALTGDTMYVTDLSGATATGLSTTAISSTGGNLPHDNLMPTLTMNYCIAYAGIFPQQS